jgi:hypothetical protein
MAARYSVYEPMDFNFRIFETPIPPDVTVVNSFVAIYEFRGLA